MLFFFLFFRMLVASFHAVSRAPNSCHSVSSRERSSNFGALGPRSWGSPGQMKPSEGFWSRILVWRAIAFLNFTRWIVFGMSVLFRRIDFGGVMSWNTQPNCRASENRRKDKFCPKFVITSFHRLPRSIVTSIWDGISFLPISLFQHSHSIFVIIRFGPFRRLFINLTMCEWTLLPKTATTLGLVNQAFWRVPSFTKWVIASFSKVILARPSRHSTTRTFTSGTSGPRWFSLTLPHERILRRIWWWTFPTLIHIVAETAMQLFPFTHCPLASHCQQSPRILLYTLFCPLILDHGVLLKISASGAKVLISNFLFDTSFHHRNQEMSNDPVKIRIDLEHFWSASTLLHGHIALVILSPLETDPSTFGALGLRSWGSLGQINPSEGFSSRIFVWRAIAFMNLTRWIGFCMSELFRKIDDHFGGSMSWKTQPNCRVFDE